MSDSDQDMEDMEDMENMEDMEDMEDMENASNDLPERNLRFTPEELLVLFKQSEKNKFCGPDRAKYLAGELNKERREDENLSTVEVFYLLYTLANKDESFDAHKFRTGLRDWIEENGVRKFIQSTIISVEKQIKLDQMFRDKNGEMEYAYEIRTELDIEHRTFDRWLKFRIKYEESKPEPLGQLCEKYEIRNNEKFQNVFYKRAYAYAVRKVIQKLVMQNAPIPTKVQAEAIGRDFNMSARQVIELFKKERQKKRKFDGPKTTLSKKKRPKKTKYEDDEDYKPPSKKTETSGILEKRHILDMDPIATCCIGKSEPLDLSLLFAAPNTMERECSDPQSIDIVGSDYDEQNLENWTNHRTDISDLNIADDNWINEDLVEEESVAQLHPKVATEYENVESQIIQKEAENEDKVLDSMDARSGKQKESSRNENENQAQLKTMPNKLEFLSEIVESFNLPEQLIHSLMETTQYAANPTMNVNSPTILSNSPTKSIGKPPNAKRSSSHSTVLCRNPKDAKHDGELVVESVGEICSLLMRDIHSLSGKEFIESGVIQYKLSQFTSDLSNTFAQKNVKLWRPQGELFGMLVYDNSKDEELECPLNKKDREIMIKNCKEYSSWAKMNNVYSENRIVILPVNHSGHWMIAVIVNPIGAIKQTNQESDQDPCCILFFDSMGLILKQISKLNEQGLSEREVFVKEVLVTYMEESFNAEYGQLEDLYFEESRINFKSVEGVPQQNNGYDCGLFVIGFARAILYNIGNWLPHVQNTQDLDWKKICPETSSFSFYMNGLRRKIYDEALAASHREKYIRSYNLQFEENDASHHEEEPDEPPHVSNNMESFAGNHLDQEELESVQGDEYETENKFEEAPYEPPHVSNTMESFGNHLDEEDRESFEGEDEFESENESEEVHEKDEVEPDSFDAKTNIVADDQETVDGSVEEEDEVGATISKPAMQPIRCGEGDDLVYLGTFPKTPSSKMALRSERCNSKFYRAQSNVQRSRWPLLLNNDGSSCFINAAMNMIHAVPQLRRGLANAPKRGNSELLNCVAHILRGKNEYVPLLRQLMMKGGVGNAQTLLIFIFNELYNIDKGMDCWNSIQCSYGGCCSICLKQIPDKEELMVELGMRNQREELQHLFNRYISQLFIRCPDCQKRVKRSYRAPQDYLIVNINGQNQNLFISNFNPNAYFSFFSNAWEPVAFVRYQYRPERANHYLSYIKLDSGEWKCVNDHKADDVKVFPEMQVDTIVFKRITKFNRFH